MSKPEKLSKKARREIERIGSASGLGPSVDRLDHLTSAVNFMKEQDIKPESILDVLLVAEFLATGTILEHE